MKRNILLALFIALVSAVALPAQQSLRSAYFMEGYNYRHELNPAFAAQRSYFALSTLGGVNAGIQSNMGVNTFLYPVDGGLTTFMNSSVSSDEFLGKLKKNNKLSVDVSTTLLSLGIWSGKSFWTFDMKTKVGADLNVPYALFDFMKNAGNSQFYDIAGLAARIDSRMEFSLGYARNINDIVNFGARVKFLLGIGNMEMKVNKMKVQMNEDKWSVDSKGSLNVSMGLLNIPTEGEIDSETAPENYDRISFDNIDTKDNLSIPSDMINGYGAAIDLGAEIEIIPDLRLSLAINDLGFMSWRNNVLATTDEKGWSFDGFDNFSFDSEKDNSLKNQFNDIGDGLEDLIKFRKVSDGGKRAQMLAMTMNFGAQYVMPFYDGLSVAALSTTRFDGSYRWTEGRFYLDLTPARWFSFGVNYGISSFGSSMGAAIGFHTSGFSMFLGTDHIAWNYAKAADLNGTAINYPYGPARLGLNFSVSFNVGRRRGDSALRSLFL